MKLLKARGRMAKIIQKQRLIICIKTDRITKLIEKAHQADKSHLHSLRSSRHRIVDIQEQIDNLEKKIDDLIGYNRELESERDQLLEIKRKYLAFLRNSKIRT